MPGTVRVARRSRPWDRLPIVKARPKGQAAYRPAGKLTLSAREKRLADLLAEKSISHERDIWGYDSEHHWYWWRQQLAHHFGKTF